MSDELLNLPEEVPVFPLPGVVLFPGTIIPLHMFEPRYRVMTADALAGPRCIAIALLKPGWEPLYHTLQAPIHETVGVGQIVESEEVGEGNYNVLLRGVARAVIVEESRAGAYRVARVERLETYCSADHDASHKLRSGLFKAIRGNPGLDPLLRKQWQRLRNAPVDLEELTDLLSASVPAAPELRQCLLAEPDAASRGELLLVQIQALAAITRNVQRADRVVGHNLN